MMKKITLLFVLLAVSLGYSQTVYEDFETTLSGTAIVHDGAAGSSTQVANPDAALGSGNESANVLEIITGNLANPWQNGQLFAEGNWSADLTDGNPTGNKIITVDVWSDTPTAILAKIVDGPSGAGAAGSEVATDANHGGTGWETLTFDFAIPKDCGGNYCGPAFEVYTRILFFPLWNGAGFDGGAGNSPVTTTYYDNITKASAVASNKDFKIAGLSTYPNPTGDSWTVKTQNINMSSIEVFDILGKNVLSLKPNASETTINGSSLKSGLYFARINTLNGSSSLKLIKN
jgi:hypothetical protein